jgi:DUF1680 family protein
MNELTGDAKYIDVLERSLYNAALDGLSETGDHFFYDNPLASNGQHREANGLEPHVALQTYHAWLKALAIIFMEAMNIACG